jgi:hypothetical protein
LPRLDSSGLAGYSVMIGTSLHTLPTVNTPTRASKSCPDWPTDKLDQLIQGISEHMSKCQLSKRELRSLDVQVTCSHSDEQ